MASPTGCSSATPASSACRPPPSRAAIVYSGVMTFVLLKVVGVVFPLRANATDEAVGLDVTQHGEEAYIHAGTAIRCEERTVVEFDAYCAL